MKKIIPIFLLCLYTFGATEAYQLLKLPLLVQHFVQHKQQDEKMGFLAFLKMHYAEKTVKDADYQQDMKLPFKTNDSDLCMSASVSFPVPFFILETVYTPSNRQTFPTKNVHLHLFHSQSSVFQPPKVNV